jgi:hypothetical protein
MHIKHRVFVHLQWQVFSRGNLKAGGTANHYVKLPSKQVQDLENLACFETVEKVSTSQPSTHSYWLICTQSVRISWTVELYHCNCCLTCDGDKTTIENVLKQIMFILILKAYVCFPS